MALPEGANDEPQGVYRKRMRHTGKSCPTRRHQLSSDLPGFRRNALPAGQDAIRYKLFSKMDLQIQETPFASDPFFGPCWEGSGCMDGVTGSVWRKYRAMGGGKKFGGGG